MGIFDKMTDEEYATQNSEQNAFYKFNGLTKREYMATHILSGLAARGDNQPIRASVAVDMADQLLLELAKETA